MDCGNIQGWIPYAPPKRVSVVEGELDSILGQARALSCTDLKCKSTGIGRVTLTCPRCELVEAIEKLDRREVP